MQLVLFDVAETRFALPLARVREVVGAVLPAPLPGAPGPVEGVIDVRGELLPVIDLRARFGLAPEPVRADQHMVIAERSAGRAVALRVGRADWVEDVPEAEVAAGSSFTRGAERIAGVTRIAGELVLIQDLDRLLDEAEELALAAALERHAEGA